MDDFSLQPKDDNFIRCSKEARTLVKANVCSKQKLSEQTGKEPSTCDLTEDLEILQHIKSNVDENSRNLWRSEDSVLSNNFVKIVEALEIT
eukprot:11770040-Ditylum_brightwellii.AAC.1